MRTTILTALLTLGILSAAGSAHAVCDGASPSITVAANETKEVVLPDDGRLECTTVTVAANGTLTFRKNALNTPVYILATGDVVVSGRIDVAGRPGTSSPPLGGAGGPGGFDGGEPGIVQVPPGAGGGPGAGAGGTSASA